MSRGQQAAMLIGALILLAALGLGGTYGGCSRDASSTEGADSGQFERVQDVERLLQGTWSGVLPDSLYDGGFSGSYELAEVADYDDPDAAAPGYTGELEVGGQSIAFTYAPEGGRGPATLTIGARAGEGLVFTQQ